MSTTQRYDDDGASARRVLGGDVDAFEGIVERWQGPLINLAYRYCRNRGEAEELAQEAFIKVFKGLGKWRQDSRFSTWLCAVAANHYRSAMRRRRPVWADIETIERLVPAGDRAQEVDEASQAEAIRRAVATLPLKYRDVTVLYYFHDDDLAETSRIMSLPSGTVKARLHRARKMLETKLSTVLDTSPLREAHR